jgi:hypothetical protein
VGGRYGNPGEVLRQVTLRNGDVKAYFGGELLKLLSYLLIYNCLICTDSIPT